MILLCKLKRETETATEKQQELPPHNPVAALGIEQTSSCELQCGVRRHHVGISQRATQPQLLCPPLACEDAIPSYDTFTSGSSSEILGIGG